MRFHKLTYPFLPETILANSGLLRSNSADPNVLVVQTPSMSSPNFHPPVAVSAPSPPDIVPTPSSPVTRPVHSPKLSPASASRLMEAENDLPMMVPIAGPDHVATGCMSIAFFVIDNVHLPS